MCRNLKWDMGRNHACLATCFLSFCCSSCLTLCDPKDCSPPGKNTGVGSPGEGDHPSPGIEPRSPALAGQLFYCWATNSLLLSLPPFPRDRPAILASSPAQPLAPGTPLLPLWELPPEPSKNPCWWEQVPSPPFSKASYLLSCNKLSPNLVA